MSNRRINKLNNLNRMLRVRRIVRKKLLTDRKLLNWNMLEAFLLAMLIRQEVALGSL
jgi:dimeric dUTPase (all-alpha-NTP-PPase superfamily)